MSGADSITLLPHQGYLIRTQPNSKLQGTSHAEFIAGMGKKKVAVIGIQAPFALSTKETLDNVLKSKGASVVSHMIYEKDKPTYRSEIDQAMKSDPDLPLSQRLRAGHGGGAARPVQGQHQPAASSPSPMRCRKRRWIRFPPEVSAGLFTGQPSADIDGQAFKLAASDWGSSPTATRRRRPTGRAW